MYVCIYVCTCMGVLYCIQLVMWCCGGGVGSEFIGKLIVA